MCSDWLQRTVRILLHLLGHTGKWLQASLNQRLQNGGVKHTVVMLRYTHAGEEVRQDTTAVQDSILHTYTLYTHKIDVLTYIKT